MSQQVVIFNNEFSMSSYEFLSEVINPARAEAGEAPVRNDQFLARVRDELDDCKTFATERITPRGGGRQMEPITAMVIADHITITSSHSVCALLPAGLPIVGGLSRSVGCDFRVQTKGVQRYVSTSSHL